MQNTINRSAAFTRQDTKAIKGIAVLLMLFHHLAGFPDRVPETFAGFRSLLPGFIEGGYLTDFAGSAKICVSLFFFLGGDLINTLRNESRYWKTRRNFRKTMWKR